MKSYRFRIVLVCAVMLVCALRAPVLAESEWEQHTAVQVMLGASRYDDLAFEFASREDPDVVAISEFTWVPLLGIGGQLPFRKGDIDMGLEGGVLFGWRSERISAYATNTSISVHIRSSLFLTDLFMGPYASARLGRHSRIYAGIGPLLLFGQYDRKSDGNSDTAPYHEHADETSSAFGVGVYARTGIEFRLPDDSWMGIGLRVFTSDLDFDTVPGTTTLRGIQGMITYTVGL